MPGSIRACRRFLRLALIGSSTGPLGSRFKPFCFANWRVLNRPMLTVTFTWDDSICYDPALDVVRQVRSVIGRNMTPKARPNRPNLEVTVTLGRFPHSHFSTFPLFHRSTFPHFQCSQCSQFASRLLPSTRSISRAQRASLSRHGRGC